MNRKIIFVVSTGISAAALLALRIYDRREETKHIERMVNLERETQNLREFREGKLDPLMTELDRKIEAAKFWLIVTEPS